MHSSIHAYIYSFHSIDSFIHACIHSFRILRAWVPSFHFISVQFSSLLSSSPTIPISKMFPIIMSFFWNFRPGACRALPGKNCQTHDFSWLVSRISVSNCVKMLGYPVDLHDTQNSVSVEQILKNDSCIPIDWTGCNILNCWIDCGCLM